MKRRPCRGGYSFVGVWRCPPEVGWLVGVSCSRCEDCVFVGGWHCCRSVCWMIGVGCGFRRGYLRADWGCCCCCRWVYSSTGSSRGDPLTVGVGLVRFFGLDSSMAGAGDFFHRIFSLVGVEVTSKAWWLGSMRLLWSFPSSC